MDIRVLLFCVIIGFGLLCIMRNKHDAKTRKVYIRLVIVLLLLESCLRSIWVGTDTISYYREFLDVINESWKAIWQRVFDAYVLGEGKDAGFHFLIKGFQWISTDFNLFLFFIGLLFYIPLGRILYLNTNNMWQLTFAFTLYVALFQIIALSGIRQQIATGGCFIAYLMLLKGNFKMSVMIVLLSGLFHLSSLIFLILILLFFLTEKFNLHFEKGIHVVSFALIPLMLRLAQPFILFLASFSKNDYYASYADRSMEGGAETFFYLMILLSLFCFLFISKKAICQDRSLKLMYLTIPMATILSPLVMLDGSMIRLGQYFTLYMMMLFPIGIELSFKKSRQLLYFIAIIILVVLSLKNSFDYTFFWQIPNS